MQPSYQFTNRNECVEAKVGTLKMAFVCATTVAEDVKQEQANATARPLPRPLKFLPMHLRTWKAEERMQGMRRQQHLRTWKAEELMQGMRQGMTRRRQHLRAWKGEERMQGERQVCGCAAQNRSFHTKSWLR